MAVIEVRPIRRIKSIARSGLNALFLRFGYTRIMTSATHDGHLDTAQLVKNEFAKISFAQQGEDLILARILQRGLSLEIDTHGGFYVDVGAYHPHSHSTTYLLYERGWRGIAIDMSEATCALYRKMRPRDIVVNAAASDKGGTMTGYFANEISLRNTIEADGLADWVDYYEKDVEVRRLDTILAEHPEVHEIDYLNIDAEGAEISVMDGLDFTKWRPKCISNEIHGSGIKEAIQSDIARYLLERDYVLVGCAVITYFFVDAGALSRVLTGPKAQVS